MTSNSLVIDVIMSYQQTITTWHLCTQTFNNLFQYDVTFKHVDVHKILRLAERMQIFACYRYDEDLGREFKSNANVIYFESEADCMIVMTSYYSSS
jgi:hypothetical protein